MKLICLREEIHLLVCFFASSPCVSYKIFCVGLLKTVLPFLTNQAPRFISRGISCSCFSGNFLLSFLLWYDFMILVKSMRGGTFLSLASSVNVWQNKFFFNWKLNTSSFIFLIWTEQFWIWFRWKLTKTVKISIIS